MNKWTPQKTGLVYVLEVDCFWTKNYRVNFVFGIPVPSFCVSTSSLWPLGTSWACATVASMLILTHLLLLLTVPSSTLHSSESQPLRALLSYWNQSVGGIQQNSVQIIVQKCCPDQKTHVIFIQSTDNPRNWEMGLCHLSTFSRGLWDYFVKNLCFRKITYRTNELIWKLLRE